MTRSSFDESHLYHCDFTQFTSQQQHIKHNNHDNEIK